MKKGTYIILIAVGDDVAGGRGKAEYIENQTFVDDQELTDKYFDGDRHRFEFYELTVFMDICNNQELDLDSYWISYVTMGE